MVSALLARDVRRPAHATTLTVLVGGSGPLFGAACRGHVWSGLLGQGLHQCFECGGPAFPVGAAGFGGDSRDELLPERFPVAAERVLDRRSCERENGALPGCVERQLAVAAGQVQVRKAQRGAHSRATPIIESRVTRPVSSASVKPPLPGGRCGSTR